MIINNTNPEMSPRAIAIYALVGTIFMAALGGFIISDTNCSK
jgi:hypothetical protein